MNPKYTQSHILNAVFAEIDQLRSDEGYVSHIYRDTLGFPTVGIGSLLTEDDPEFGMPEGTPFSEERIFQMFVDELLWKVIPDVKYIYPDYEQMPQEAVQIAINLLYQLGRTKYQKFVKHVAAMKSHDWNTAAAELRDSRLYKQAIKRTERRAKRLEALA